MFLTLMVIGLAGLAVMALPALTGAARGHGGAHAVAPHHGLHAPVGVRSLGLVKGKLAPPTAGGGGTLAAMCLRFLLSPRVLFSLLALYGAFANALVHAGHLLPGVAALVAIVPTILVERFAVSPLWNLAFRYQGQPSSSMGALVLEEAKAVTPFRNGRGVVAVVRDGRLVQFSAHLAEREGPPRSVSVGVGDRLLVEDVDAGREHLTVSVPDPKV